MAQNLYLIVLNDYLDSKGMSVRGHGVEIMGKYLRYCSQKDRVPNADHFSMWLVEKAPTAFVGEGD